MCTEKDLYLFFMYILMFWKNRDTSDIVSFFTLKVEVNNLNLKKIFRKRVFVELNLIHSVALVRFVVMLGPQLLGPVCSEKTNIFSSDQMFLPKGRHNFVINSLIYKEIRKRQVPSRLKSEPCWSKGVLQIRRRSPSTGPQKRFS